VTRGCFGISIEGVTFSRRALSGFSRADAAEGGRWGHHDHSSDVRRTARRTSTPAPDSSEPRSRLSVSFTIRAPSRSPATESRANSPMRVVSVPVRGEGDAASCSGALDAEVGALTHCEPCATIPSGFKIHGPQGCVGSTLNGATKQDR
jgi:hypothetical protein